MGVTGRGWANGDSDTKTEATCRGPEAEGAGMKAATVALEQKRQAGEDVGCQSRQAWWFLGVDPNLILRKMGSL